MTPRLWFYVTFTVLSLQAAAENSLPPKERVSPELTGDVSDLSPLVKQYCFKCHGEGKSKGDVTLDHLLTEKNLAAQRPLWARVKKMVRSREMPPENKPQPTELERTKLLDWIDRAVFQIDCQNPDPGRVTIRRLNRTEYNNTVRDLIGVDFKPAADFPVDDSGYGFDNISDALSLPPVLAEKYLAAAETIVEAALGLHQAALTKTNRYSIDLLEVGYNAKQQGDGSVALNSIEEDDVAIAYNVASESDYVIRVKAWASQETNRPIELTFMRDEIPLQVVIVATNRDAPAVYPARVTLPPGRHRLRATVRRIKDGLGTAAALRWRSGPPQKGTVFVEWLEVEGPFKSRDRSPFYERTFAQTERLPARLIIQRFADRAFRRPARPDELDRLVSLADTAMGSGDSFEEGVALAMQAILASPHFLYRGELQTKADHPPAIYAINEYALAERLSYFLWSTMPDEELFAQARAGTLRTNLQSQVRRMLADPKARALVDNFAGQWLQLRNLTLLTPGGPAARGFDEPLRDAMRQETELFFENVMREDRTILDFLNADYTFLNERLGRHYGIKGIQGDEFQRVSLQGSPRRGILTHASILALTSNPTRTSPVKRGKWVLENLLNTPPPPPPPDVPELNEKQLTGTLRQQMEQHRENVLCASCHGRMDAIGFGLENFNAIGAWREKDGDFPIESHGDLGGGAEFKGPLELVDLLATSKKDQFVRCLIEKLLTYALGRGIEYYDECAIDRIAEALAAQQYRFSALIFETVKSVPFQQAREPQ